ncbi:extracellular repeat-containing protein, HAF family [Agrobacterium albertimagni AOL15]|uniref:Extracellular repeat-containing protein, HAF family n=2 Tax=Agrobacterium albertimagni TaxID=147266 RepID=K2PEJ2_9HYPH|nr:extracellular repeat-containing protein, HAF family [Agrobacterium albertimagni AOL15]
MGDPMAAVTSGFRWTSASGLTSAVAAPFGWTSMLVTDVSADGSVYVGTLFGGSPTQAYRTSVTAGTQDLLGFLPGGAFSRAAGVSGDGNVVAGWGTSTNGNRAFRWTYDPVTLSGIMVELGTSNGRDAVAKRISRDGRVIVGGLLDPSFRSEAAYWIENDAPVTLGYLPGGDQSTANAVNSDGSVIVGEAVRAGGVSAFRWTAASGMVDLGRLGRFNSEAIAVSDDGNIVVGRTGRLGGSSSGFRWTEANGMITVDDWLRQSGVTLSEDVTSVANAVSADGTVIVGMLRNSKTYIARGAATDPSDSSDPTVPGHSAGIIAVEDYMQSFNGLPRHILVPQQVADLAMNGANSSPLFHRLSAGQRSIWATGDIGAVRNDFGTGPTATGEIGFAYAPTDDVTLRLALGTSYSKGDLDLGGFSRVQGSYVLPEASLALAPSVYATLTGFASIGDLSMRRAYLNGTGTDISEGEADTRTLGFRARLDWLDSFEVQSVAFTPYASFTHLATKTDGYAETGGSFPARFDETKGASNTLRFGTDARHDLTSAVSLVGRGEIAHRFEDQAPNTRGQILGFSGFDLAGAPIEQTWLRGAIGVQTKSGPLEGQLMLNASSQGEGSYWLSASTRIVF